MDAFALFHFMLLKMNTLEMLIALLNFSSLWDSVCRKEKVVAQAKAYATKIQKTNFLVKANCLEA